MLRINEIYKIIREIEFLYVMYAKHCNSYKSLRQKVLDNGTNVKYSAGGNTYPFGKYFFGKSQIYKKAVRKSSGHFCKTLDEANFAYVFSDDGKLLAINQMFDTSKNSEGYVDYTSFLEYGADRTYILKYREDDIPSLQEIGIIYLKNNCEIMVHSSGPCEFFIITVIDYAENKEYSYSIGKELFISGYNMKSDEMYPDVWSITRR